MKRHRVEFDFSVDFVCEADEIKDMVANWWSETTDVPDYDYIEILEEE